MRYKLTCYLLIASISSIQTTRGQYLRPSIAYYFDRSSGVLRQYDVNQPCYRTMAVCNVSDGEYLRHESTRGKDISVYAKNDRYFFGIETGCGYLYRSKDGITNWEPTPWSQYLNAGVVWALESGTILISDRVTDDGLYQMNLYRSVDDGNTVDLAIPFGGDGFSNDKAFIRHWSVVQASRGTIIVTEYGKPSINSSGRRIFRSNNDGQTFEKVWDAVEQGEVYTHHHVSCYHEGLGRWVVACGDGKQYRHLMASDEDGIAGSWYNLTQPHRDYDQPTAFIDYGHPTRLLFGSDTTGQVGWLEAGDVNTGQFGNVLTNWDPRNHHNTCFLIFEHDGVYYACNNVLSASYPRSAVISVSKDLEHWAIYHRFDNNEEGPLKYAGYSNGKLHLSVSQANGDEFHFIISPAQVSTQTTLVVEPGTTNMFEDYRSTLERNLTGWWFSDLLTTHKITSYEKFHGDTSLQLGGILPAGAGNMAAITPYITVEAGRTYQGRFWIKGKTTRIESNYKPYTASSAGESVCTLSDDTWQEVVLEPYTVRPDDGNQLALKIYIGDIDPTSDSEELEVYIDSLQIEETIGTNWHPGGISRASTKLKNIQTLPEEWTDIFTFYPAGRKEYYDGLAAGKKLYIKSWQAGNSSAELFYDPNNSISKDDDEFVLYVTNGQHSYSLRTGAQHFQKEAQIKIGIVCYQVDGGSWDPKSDISEPNDDIIDERDLAVFARDWLSKEALSPADFDDDNDVDWTDFAFLASNWLDTTYKKTWLKMHISNGRGVESPIVNTGGRLFNDFSSGSVTVCLGDRNEENLFPGLISNDKFLLEAVTDANIKQVFNDTQTSF